MDDEWYITHVCSQSSTSANKLEGRLDTIVLVGQAENGRAAHVYGWQQCDELAQLGGHLHDGLIRAVADQACRLQRSCNT